MSTMQLWSEKMLQCYLPVIGFEHHNVCVIGSVLVFFKGSVLFLLEPIFDMVQLSSASFFLLYSWKTVTIKNRIRCDFVLQHCMENQLLFITALWLVDLKQEGDFELTSRLFKKKDIVSLKLSDWLCLTVLLSRQ